MNKHDFLQQADENLLDYEISDTVGSNGEESVGVVLSVGNIPPGVSQCEVLLTKENIRHLLSEIEQFEENGPDYLDEK
jgi:hypothetical protein